MADLLRSRRNLIFLELRAQGWDTSDFRWTDSQLAHADNEPSLPALAHRPSGYFFVFGEPGHKTSFSPGEDRLHHFIGLYDWDETITFFRRWLKYIKREMAEPDLWATASVVADAEIQKELTESEETAFTTDEAELLRESVESLKEHLRARDLINEANQAYITGRLDYLTDQIPRQGRVAWIHLAIGVLFTIAVTLQLPSDETRDMFQVFWQMVKHLINVPHSLPLP